MRDLPQQMTIHRVFSRHAGAALRMGVLGAILALTACVTDQPAKEQEVLAFPPRDEARFYYEQTIRASTDVVEETSQQRLRRLATGEVTAGKGLSKPWGVAAWNGYLFVGDTVGRSVHGYDLIEKRYWQFGNEGEGALAKPLDMTIDANKRLYVVDATGRRVVVYDFDGKYLYSVGDNEELLRPSGVAVNPEGTRIYVLDTGGVESLAHRVVVYDDTGVKVSEFGTRGGGEGEFNLPLSIVMAPNRQLYVVDAGNFRVQAFDEEGNFIMQFGGVGRQSGQFARPKGIDADGNSNLYITDAAFANFQIFNEDGQLLLFIGQRGDGGPASYMLPAGIAVDPVDGRIYVVDQFYRKVDVFRPATTPEERSPREPSATAS